MSKAQLTVKNRKTGERKSYRIDQDLATIGREAGNFVVLEGKNISRRHAEIVHEGDQFFLKDLKSGNGTSLNERRLPPQEKALLRSNDMIQIEDHELLFHIPAEGEEEDIYETTDADLLEIKMVKKLLKAIDRQSAPSIEVLEGPQIGFRFVLEEKNQDILIGRDPACECVIDSETISRKHARIEKRFDTVILHDLKSKNGTFVNHQRIQHQRLQDGDVIHLGTLSTIFKNPQELVFDIEPPQIDSKADLRSRPKAAAPDDRPTGEIGTDKPSPARASRRRGEEAAPEPLPEEESAPTSAALPKRLGLSITEIVTILIGAAVLIGSIWGILKLI